MIKFKPCRFPLNYAITPCCSSLSFPCQVRSCLRPNRPRCSMQTAVTLSRSHDYTTSLVTSDVQTDGRRVPVSAEICIIYLILFYFYMKKIGPQRSRQRCSPISRRGLLSPTPSQFPKIRYADVDGGTSSSVSLSSSSPNNSTAFFHTRSVIRSNDTSWFIRWRTHATPPIAHGSFLPLTAFPRTNLSGLVSGGKYSDRSD